MKIGTLLLRICINYKNASLELANEARVKVLTVR